MGTAAGVTNFCGLHANVYGEIKQVVHGIADDLLVRIERLGGLNAPHLVFGNIFAQAYDMVAYKCAADDLLLSDSVDILFHALAAGVAMDFEGRIKALLIETNSGRSAILGALFYRLSATAISPPLPCGIRKGDADGHTRIHPRCFACMASMSPPRVRPRTIPASMDAAEKRGASFPRKGAIVRPQEHSNEWRVNVTEVKTLDGHAVDGTDARELSAGEIEGRQPSDDVL